MEKQGNGIFQIFHDLREKIQTKTPIKSKKSATITLGIFFLGLLLITRFIGIRIPFLKEIIVPLSSVSAFYYLLFLGSFEVFKSKKVNLAFSIIGAILVVVMTVFTLIPREVTGGAAVGASSNDNPTLSTIFTIIFIMTTVVYLFAFLWFLKGASNGVYILVGMTTPLLSALIVVGIIVLLLIQFVKILIQLVKPVVADSKIGKAAQSGWEGKVITDSDDYVVYKDGNSRTLTYYGYDSIRGCDRYKDDVGDYWLTKDRQTFEEENNPNAPKREGLLK